MEEINYPFRIDGRGRVARTENQDTHIRQLIEQLLFTESGERVNRPDFGSGLYQLIFAPNSGELATTTQFLVQGALEQWLGDLIQVEAVDVQNVDSRLEVTIRYIVRRSQEEKVGAFVREVSS
ncbi:MAG: GPW/gp25 family protein [Crocosphaera sp.]|nr:GPW/gp25 family protein [Crocosphaera sp.]